MNLHISLIYKTYYVNFRRIKYSEYKYIEANPIITVKLYII